MPPLSVFALPLQNGPLPGFDWHERESSATSCTAVFDTGIEKRDTFDGMMRCIICGSTERTCLQRGHINQQAEPDTWVDLKHRQWIPSQAKQHPTHEPRNGMVLCGNHHLMFDGYAYFLRYIPAVGKFVFVNFSNSRDPNLTLYHGKAVALDTTHRYSPFPSLFIIQEMRVRGHHPFQPVSPDIPDDPPFQDWMVTDGLVDESGRSFNRESHGHNRGSGPTSPGSQLPTITGGAIGGASSGFGGTSSGLALNADVISDILEATRQMPSWKACQIEGTSWDGTGEENIQKYLSEIGIS